jgi:hypothetical protein
MPIYEGVDSPAMGGKGVQRGLFIFPDEAAVAVYIGAEYCGELTFQTLTSKMVRLDLSGNLSKR